MVAGLLGSGLALQTELLLEELLAAGAAFGSLVGWDPRKPGDALKFDGDLRQVLTIAMCLGADETWVAAATSSHSRYKLYSPDFEIEYILHSGPPGAGGPAPQPRT